MNKAPWKDEPDSDTGEFFGYRTMIRRTPELLHLCGYVRIPKGHPCYGADWDSDLLEDICVHGGITWCRKSAPGEKPDGGWWIGFDCAHAWDIGPGMLSTNMYRHGLDDMTYKTMDFVRDECERLAKQLKEKEDEGSTSPDPTDHYG